MTDSETGFFRNESGASVELPVREGGARLALRTLDTGDIQNFAAAFAGMEPWSRYPFSPAALSAYLGASEAGAPRYAIVSGDTPCGVLGLQLNWLRGPYIQFLGILPSFQGRGLGSQTVDWLASRAKAVGARNLWVAASSFNEGAHRFYGRHGFDRVAFLDSLIQEDVDELLFRKRLD